MTRQPDVIFVRAARTDDDSVISRHRELSRTESTSYRGSLTLSMDLESDIRFVAGVGDTVLGSLAVRRVSDTSWSITHVFVEPMAREVGIGDALVLHCLRYLRDADAHWVGAQALPGDRAMKNLFERHGLVAQTIIVGKSLSDPSTEADASQ